MSTADQIEGREFDWFAADSAGRIAMFATAGAGFVPELVIADCAAHENLSDRLPVERWGSEKVWDVYAKLGMYVYDWDNVQGWYRRLRVPSQSMPDDLANCFRQLATLPRLDFVFANQAVIEFSRSQGT